MIDNADDEQVEGLNSRIAELLREVERLNRLLVEGQGTPNSCAQFVMWALMEGSWQGADIDGGAAQDKAEALGLIVQTTYDPVKHGEGAWCEPGDVWYVPSEKLLAALSAPSQGSDAAGQGGTS